MATLREQKANTWLYAVGFEGISIDLKSINSRKVGQREARKTPQYLHSMIDPNNLLNNTLANRAEYMSGVNELQPGLGQLNTGEANLYDER